MTKKDYIAIAAVLRFLGTESTACFDSPDDREHIAQEFANMLARDNPRFDRTRFVKAALPVEDTK